MSTRTSHCYCGAIELEITGDPKIQAYCHCTDCRGWLGAPLHAAALFPTADVRVTKGEDKLGVFKKTEASHRHFCTGCGAGVFVIHPELDMTDVPAGSIDGLEHKPTAHVYYSEKVVAIRDGLPKFKAFGPADPLPE